jgi:chemotaxis signal transduction protein
MAIATQTSTSRHDLYVLLIFDGLYLLVPQDDVESVEIVSDIRHDYTMDNGVIGWFNRHGYEAEVPIFCLSGDLLLSPDVPESREYFVLLKTAEHSIGILCDEVENLNLKLQNLRIQPMPAIMQSSTSPMSGLVIYQDLIAGVCRGVALTTYILKLAEAFGKAF